MAWIDDTIAAHPKWVPLTDRAFRTAVQAIAYSSGFGLRGFLEPAHQQLVGADKRVRAELVAARLWDDIGDGRVYIHDWDVHNGKRDDRRERERERKRRARREGRWNESDRTRDETQDGAQNTTNKGRESGRAPDAAPARVEGSEGSEGTSTRAVTELQDAACATDETNGPGFQAPNLRSIQ